MAHETTNNPRNDGTITTKKSVEKSPSSRDLAGHNFVSSDVDHCINNFRRSEKQNAKKNKKKNNKKQNKTKTKTKKQKKASQQSQQIAKRLLIVGDCIVKNIEPYKMKKVQNTLPW